MVHYSRRFVPALLIIGVAIGALGQLIPLSAVHASTNQSQAITLSPASTEVVVDPGKTASKSLDIINSGSDPFNIKLSSSPYYVTGETYDPHFTQLPGTVDPSSWVHLSLTNTTVGGLKVVTIPYTIEVPKATTPGGYYAVVFVETSSNDEKTGVVSHNRVGDILYITVNGTIESGGNITGSPLPTVSFGGSIPISAKISNSGGTHFITRAVYTVSDMTGKAVFNATTERYVLPQTEREITSSWSPQSLFGIFTVKRNATINGSVKSLPDEKIVIINPWIFVLLAFVIGILISLSVQRARLRRRSKEK